MFLILVFLVVVAFGLWCLWYYVYGERRYETKEPLVIGWLIIACTFLGLAITSGVGYSAQREDVEELTRLRDDMAISARQYDELAPIVEEQLINRFPEMQAEIIANIDTPEILLTYPTLAEAGQSIRDGVDRLINFRQDLYGKQYEINELLAELRTRDANPWFVHFPGWPTWDDEGPEDEVVTEPIEVESPG